MRLRLDDNERGAFHYLFGGVAVVIALKGIAFITDRLGPALTEDQAALRHFQGGYPLLRGELAIVSTPSGLTERLILAVVLAVGVAFTLALVFVLLGRKRRRAGGAGFSPRAAPCSSPWPGRCSRRSSCPWRRPVR